MTASAMSINNTEQRCTESSLLPVCSLRVLAVLSPEVPNWHWALWDKGKDLSFAGHGRAAGLFLPRLTALLFLSNPMPKEKSFHGVFDGKSNGQNSVGKNGKGLGRWNIVLS